MSDMTSDDQDLDTRSLVRRKELLLMSFFFANSGDHSNNSHLQITFLKHPKSHQPKDTARTIHLFCALLRAVLRIADLRSSEVVNTSHTPSVHFKASAVSPTYQTNSQ
jgi:hypothetical protein